MAQTTITVDEETLERFNQLKSESQPDHLPEPNADLFLQSLMDEWEYDGGVGNLQPYGGEVPDVEIGMSQDDVRLACEKAIEKKLPDRVLE